MVGDQFNEIGNLAREISGKRNGVGALGEERSEVLVVREDVVVDFGLDFEGSNLESVDEEAEIRCGEWRGVVEVLGGEEITDVD